MAFNGKFADKRVLITGHTGFKGSWLSEWMLSLGAQVHGFALAPEEGPSLFRDLGLASRIHGHVEADIRDLGAIKKLVTEVKPEFVFHLAAQPLVRHSYNDPVGTYEVNVMGTVHVLEALRHVGKPCSVIAVTTDKCYENKEWVHAYREEDPMGGYDPYSSSKGAAELVIAAYRRSYFGVDSPIRLASGRAGNVIGGGDWAADRIVPDCIRSLREGRAIPVRNKTATRPWQHVLEPLSGYLSLAAGLHEGGELLPVLTSGYNFGPELSSNKTVKDLVCGLLKYWPGEWEDKSDPNAPHEASLLNLTIDKAFHFLKWAPTWNFDETISRTANWYRSANENQEPTQLCSSDIRDYEADARRKKISWAVDQSLP